MSHSEFTANADILSNLTGPRLAVLEAADLARRYSAQAGILGRQIDWLAARVENRIIERVLRVR